jgi:hypothetical protein
MLYEVIGPMPSIHDLQLPLVRIITGPDPQGLYDRVRLRVGLTRLGNKLHPYDMGTLSSTSRGFPRMSATVIFKSRRTKRVGRMPS